MSGTLGGHGLLGGAYDPETGYRQQNPQLLMAQQLMKLEEPKVNASQSSFWANLLNEGLRGGLAGYLTDKVSTDQAAARDRQKTEADQAMGELDRIMRGGGAAAPQPDAAPATPDQGFDTPAATMPGTSGSAAPAGPGAIPAAQRGDIVNQAVAGTKVPPQVLAALIQQESGWNPRAVGKAGDGGLGQIIPSTAAAPGYGVAPISTADIADPVKNASFAARYLEGRGRAAGLATPEDWQDPAKLALALKAYNGGGDPNYVANVTRFMPRGTQVASSNPGLAPETGAPAPPASPFDAGMPQLGPDASGGVQVASNAPDAPALGAPAVAGDVAAIQAGMQQARTGAPAGTQVADAGASPFAGAGIELPPTRGQAMAAPLAPGGAPGQSAPTGAALAGRLLQPGQIDGLYRLSDQWAGSTNPLLRARAAGVRAQAERAEAQLNAYSNRQDTLAAQRDARQAAADNRNSETKDVLVGNDVHIFERDRSSGTWKDTGLLSGNQRPERERNPQHIVVKVDGKNYVHTWNQGTGKYENTGLLAEKQEGEAGGPYSGKSVPAEDRNIIDRLHESIANGSASEADKRRYSLAYNSLKNGTPVEIPDPKDPNRTIRVPGQPTDLTGYAPPPYRDTTPLPGKPATEAENKSAGYSTRMVEANKTLDQIGTQTFGDVMAGRAPVVGNYLTSDQGQQFRTAARAWIWAKLRKESGAAVPPAEAQQEFETYFPQPGDAPATVALKKRLRDLETQNMQRDAGNAYTPTEPAKPDTGAGGGAARRAAAIEQARKQLPPDATDEQVIAKAQELIGR
jgi:soluble lytic murein transglycosylase-like protein